jgi:hypothetical protein
LICWEYGPLPAEWNIASVASIHTKGDREKCENYRRESLLNSGYKIYVKRIIRRINTISECMLDEARNGVQKMALM